MSDTYILGPNGKRINWKKPPKPTDMCTWSEKTTGGKPIKGSFRTIAAYDRLNRRALAVFDKPIRVIQAPYNTTVAASAGTHDYDAVFDFYIPGISWWRMQRFARANGFACWYRHAPDFSNHIHGFPLPPNNGGTVSDDFRAAGFKVGVYIDGGFSLYGKSVASSQIDDYYRHAMGLSGQHAPNSDKSWFPANIKATIFSLETYCRRMAAR